MQTHQPREANFRRGTIMGLTAAEAFMLICFVLLLLLGLWRESTREALIFYEQFTPNQRAAAEIYQADLEDLGRNMNELKTFQELVAEAGGQGRVKDALKVLQEYPDLPVTEMLDRIRLFDEATIKAIAEASAKLPEDAKRKLADLAQVEQFVAIVEVAHSSPQDLLDDAQRLSQYEETGLTPDQINRLAFEAADAASLSDELTEYTSLGVGPEELKNLVQSVDQLRKAQVTSGKRIADAIRERAGDLITQMGGQILDNGDVVFPESVLFDPGRDAIRPQFDAVLSRFCVPWLHSLQEFDSSLRNIQIEGHASSEWASATQAVAFRNNLDLSQRRAANVFERCLDYTAGSALEQWAQSRLAAVGYSSSRPVMDDSGNEDRALSRRVVFALDVKTLEDLTMERLVAEPPQPRDGSDVELDVPLLSDVPTALLTNLPTGAAYEAKGYSIFRGSVSRVIDGDTIVVGQERIRLEGLHAPERTEKIGRLAMAFVEQNFLGAEAECWFSQEHTYNRTVGVCFVNEIDIAGAVVTAGLGRDCTSISAGRYASLETAEASSTLALPGYCK